MGLKGSLAQKLGRATSWGLRDVLHRTGSQLPGRVALAVDSHLIAELAGKLTQGSVMVCGTNGKTTTNNVVADALEASGARVVLGGH